jgi:hypothetical protein
MRHPWRIKQKKVKVSFAEIGVVMVSTKRTFIIEPNTGISPINIGMNRSIVRKQFSEKSHTFTKTKESNPTDTFFSNSFQIFYNNDDNVEYIELSGYQNDEFDVSIFGINIFAKKANIIYQELKVPKLLDSNDVNSAYTMILPEIDVCFWRSMIPDEEDINVDDSDLDETGNRLFWRTVGIGVKGYFKDRIRKMK